MLLFFILLLPHLTSWCFEFALTCKIRSTFEYGMLIESTRAGGFQLYKWDGQARIDGR